VIARSPDFFCSPAQTRGLKLSPEISTLRRSPSRIGPRCSPGQALIYTPHSPNRQVSHPHLNTRFRHGDRGFFPCPATASCAILPRKSGRTPMQLLKRRFSLRQFAMPVLMVFLAVISVAAQIAPTRTWEELKQETQRRVDKNLGPVGGLKSEDARETLDKSCGTARQC
jgi:hypothetical protein